MTQQDRDTYVLSTGREFYANNGIIGLGPADDDEPSEGYDGGISTVDYEDGWTAAECVELADAMIARWQAWKVRRLG